MDWLRAKCNCLYAFESKLEAYLEKYEANRADEAGDGDPYPELGIQKLVDARGKFILAFTHPNVMNSLFRFFGHVEVIFPAQLQC